MAVPAIGDPCHHGPVEPAKPEYGHRHRDIFDEIVAAWVSEGTVSRWPDDEVPPPAPSGTPRTPARHIFPVRAEMAWTTVHSLWPVRAAHAHFGVTVSVCLTLLSSGVAMLVIPGILTQPPALAPSTGLMLIALGLGWIVLRSWPTDTNHGGHDGADS
jgi:hypothetical protein